MYARFSWAAAVVLALAAMGIAQPAVEKKHPYEIGPEAGQWCICVTCFFENIDPPAGRDFRDGELEQILTRTKARHLAIDFVSVLRKDYQLPAYMFNRGDEDRKKEEERFSEQKKQRDELYKKFGAEPPRKSNRKRLAHIQDQYMVLIGGYSDQEAARRSLDAVRKLRQPPDEYCNTITAGLAAQGQTADGHKARMNPFKTAMVLPNPTGPKIKPPAVDAEELAKGLAELNANNPYSLLKHGGKMTLAVKMYRIPARVTGIDGKGDVRQASATKSGDIYEATAKQAEQLAAFLRHPQLNFEAYVLHTHAASMVTVGVFNNENDPRLATTQASLAKLRLTTNGGVEMEQLMNPPLPIPIPKGR